MVKKIFQEGKKYTFSDYFKIENPPEEILAELGYHFYKQKLELPRSTDIDTQTIENLRSFYYTIVPKISVNSEIAKRELMIAPILHNIIKIVDAKLNVEYYIDADEHLSGSIDYFFRSRQEIIIIEAKKGDLENGFKQLAAEMIGVDKIEETDSPDILYGALRDRKSVV